MPFFLPLLLPDVGEKVATKFSKVLVNKNFFSSRKVLSNIYVSKMLARGLQLFLDVVGKKSRYNRPWQVGLCRYHPVTNVNVISSNLHI